MSDQRKTDDPPPGRAARESDVDRDGAGDGTRMIDRMLALWRASARCAPAPGASASATLVPAGAPPHATAGADAPTADDDRDDRDVRDVRDDGDAATTRRWRPPRAHR